MDLFSPKKTIKASQQIKDALFQIKTLDYRERPAVYDALVKELKDSGVGPEEIKKMVKELKDRGEISEVDQQKLLELTRE